MRRILDAFIAALGSLAEHKLRTTLTMLGMMFGVGAVVAMLSIGAGAEREALALIERLGTRNVVVRAKTYKPQELEEIRKKSLGLSMRDVDAVQEAVPGVEYAAPRIEVEPYKILAAGAKTEAKVFGVSHRHRELAPLPLSEGRARSGRRAPPRANGVGAACAAICSAATRRSAATSRSTTSGEDGVGARFERVGGPGTPPTDHEIYLLFSTALRKPIAIR
jgi:putative ABC transport system permease protein